jgi:hypothetical protein
VRVFVEFGEVMLRRGGRSCEKEVVVVIILLEVEGRSGGLRRGRVVWKESERKGRNQLSSRCGWKEACVLLDEGHLLLV